jgi:hypothetical protein
MKVFLFFGKVTVERGNIRLARKIFEKCIELFSNNMTILYTVDIKTTTSTGKDKIEVKMAKAVKILLIVVMSLSIVYEKLQKFEWVTEILVFGQWFGERRRYHLIKVSSLRQITSCRPSSSLR